MNVQTLLQNLHQVVIKFKKEKDLTPLEYVEEHSKTDEALNVKIVSLFIDFAKYNPVLKILTEDFLEKNFNPNADELTVALVMYLLIVELKIGNQKDFQGFLETECFGLDLVRYLTVGDNQIIIARKFCDVFAKDYVLENIIYPLVNKQPVLKTIGDRIDEKRKLKIPSTVTEEFNVSRKCIRNFNPPPNTPLTKSLLKIKIPQYKDTVANTLEAERENNRRKALSLLEEASERTRSLAKPRETVTVVEETTFLPIKAKKNPPRKDVEVRPNLTSTLREANVYLKEQEMEINRIEDLIKGGMCKEDIAEFEAEKRLKEQQARLEDIERKHLQGLLSYEEAILAKKNQLISNQEKIAKYKEERLKIFEDLEKWKEEEQAKVKSIVSKIKDIERGAKEAEKKMQEEKQNNAKLLQYESKQLLKKFYEDNQRELEKKMQLIQEIRAMEQIRRTIAVKEFDPTESPNYGLLCEMSIAELQERLALTNLKMKEELVTKRKMIQRKKEEQQQMIESLKSFVEESKESECRKKTMPKIPEIPKKQQSNPELKQLRKKLEEKRRQRKNL